MPNDQQGVNQTTKAVIELRSRIMTGRLAGGTRLLEVQLADELDLSRTPIREAMSRLAEEGLLERSGSGGFRVRTFPPADVVDTIELRGLLEGAAARRAAERGAGAANLLRLEVLLSGLDACFGSSIDDVDLDRYSDLNSQFHALVAQSSGSVVLLREIDRVSRLPFAAPSAFLTGDRRLTTIRRSLWVAQEQHRALVEAISARQGGRAEAIAREHARAAQRNVEHLLASDATDSPDLVCLLARGAEG
jgi:GntR family transcriptional regulator, vanillate catabolism transcriptional regulator